MERWSIDVHKDYIKFSAAHFLIFPDGSAERLHGHNYKVYVDVAAALTQHGLVIDFGEIKPIVRALADELDEHWLVPGEHPVLEVREVEGQIEVEYGGKRYSAPAEDVIVLPMNNTSAENLATWFGRELRERLGRKLQDLTMNRLTVAVEETPGQRGIYEFLSDS